ncbi:MAG: electron transfer flavoprotein subunit alpha, partial [Chloroflexi bacterium]|nr:electron transfer flavoprotein subunit alpha [Chloroflexota bacterium]
MAEPKGVMVFGESVQGTLAAISGELLGCGKQLADAL